MKGKLTDATLYKLKNIPKESYLGNLLSNYQDLKQFKYIMLVIWALIFIPLGVFKNTNPEQYSLLRSLRIVIY